jgi:hypothetical protein
MAGDAVRCELLSRVKPFNQMTLERRLACSKCILVTTASVSLHPTDTALVTFNHLPLREISLM